MKDNFLHCRVAGLRTSNACVKLLDVAQTATKIIPQASILLLDKSAEVRSLALTLIDSCLELMRGHHQSLVDKARAEVGGGGVSGERMGNISGSSSSSRLYTSASADPPSGVRAGAAAAAPSSVLRATSSSNLSDDSQQTSGSGGWSSWAVLQGISKSIESATIIAPETTSATSYQQQQQQQQQQHVTTKSGSSAPVLSKATSNIGFDDELDFDPDMHDDGNDTTNNSNTEGAEETWDSGSSAKKFKAPAGSSSLSKPWDQLDDLDLEDGDDDDYSEDQRTAPSVPLHCTSSSSSNTAAAGGIATSRLNLPTTTAAAAAPINKKVVGMKLAGAGGSMKSTAATKPPKVAITKLSVDKDEGWEDF